MEELIRAVAGAVAVAVNKRMVNTKHLMFNIKWG